MLKSSKFKKLRVAWGITGAGHFLAETVELLETMNCIDIFLSRAAEEVIKSYHFQEKISQEGQRLFYDRAASSPAVNRLYLGYYGVVAVAPATSNSIAKFVYGISDSLVTNLFAHAGKARVPVVVLPTDVSPELESQAPGGKVLVYPRSIDLGNVKLLESFPGVTVVKNVQELNRCLHTYL